MVRALCISATILITLLRGSVAAAQKFSGRVVKIVDGGRMDVLRGKTLENIRLFGVDAPKSGQAYSSQAKQFLSSLALGKTVNVTRAGKDRDGRLLGEVTLADGRNLNQELVRNGCAWQYRRHADGLKLLELEQEARSSKVGLWAGSTPIPPWQFRSKPVSSKRILPNKQKPQRHAPAAITGRRLPHVVELGRPEARR